jgi:6-phosphogluconolactonase (cycloisomerase 2 family)
MNHAITAGIRLAFVFAVAASMAACGGGNEDGTAPLAPPTVTTISTETLVRGTTTSVTITGTNFVPGATTVAISGSGITVGGVTAVSATSITVSVVVAADAALGPRTVTVTTASGTSLTKTFTIAAASPTLSAITPGAALRGRTVSLSATGTNFISGATTLAVSGAGLTVQNVNASNTTSLTADLVIAADATLGARTVTVTTAGGTSAAQSLTINAPPPTLSALSVSSGVVGSSVQLTLTGTEFIPGASVLVSGTGVTVGNVVVTNTGSIAALLTIDANAAVGPRSITVVTAGGTSGAQTFTVMAPGPTLTTMTPTAALRGTTATLTLTGTNFVTGATTVNVRGRGIGVTVRDVLVLGAAAISATVVVAPDADIGSYDISVTTESGTSNSLAMTISAAPPVLASISPAIGTQGTSTVVTLTGSGFLPRATTVAVSGGGITVSGVNATFNSLTATFAVDPAAALGARSVTVTTLGGTSGAVSFTINAQPPTLASVSPSSGGLGVVVPVTLTGTSFIPGATTVAVSGSGVTASNVNVTSATTLTVDLTVAAGAALGARSVTATTAFGTTGAQTFTVSGTTPTLTGVAPNAGVQGTTVSATLTGTGFIIGGTTVAVGGGVTVSNINVTGSTSLTADFVIPSSATLGAQTVSVTTSAGTSGTQAFTINAPPPTLASVSPSSGALGAVVSVTLTGTSFIPGATTVAVSGANVTVSNVNVTSGTTLTADLTVGVGAALGARNVTATTAFGTTGAQTFTVTGTVPTLTSVVPAVGVQGTTVAGVTLTGSNFLVGGTTVDVTGTGVSVSNVNVASGTSITADFTITGTATLGAHSVTVTTGAGTSTGQTFTVNPPAPTLTSVAPTAAVQGTTQSVTLTGTNFVAGATVNVSGTGITVSNINVVNGTTITADLTLAVNATVGARNVTVTTAGGTTAAQTLTVQLPAPGLTGLSLTTGAQTGTQTITLTGTNFQAGATTVGVTGTGVTVSNVNVSSGTTLTADFAVAGGATISARNVSVTTAGGTSGTQAFNVIAAPVINSFDALATHLYATQPSRLRWSTSNAASCSINNGVGSVASCNDSLFVTPGTTKTYTLTVTSAGATVTANFQLFANEPGQFVYWTSSGGGAGTHVHQFSLNATTGNLTAIGTGLVNSGNSPSGITVDPSGSYAYVANTGSNSVSMYSINRSTGALTLRTPATIATGAGPLEVAVDPTGRFAYVVNGNSSGAGSISRYTIDGTGLLVANGTTALGTDSRGVVIDPTGRFLYATNNVSKTIQEFSINADGTLTSLGSVATSGFKAYYMTADPTGRFLYLTHDTDGRLSEYSINANGTLTLIGGPTQLNSPAPPGTYRALAVDPTGRFAYAVDYNNSILNEFTINATTGNLSRFGNPTLPHALATTQTIQQFVIDPQGKFAYGTDNNNGNIIMFTIDANGVLSPVTAPLSVIAGGTSPFGIVVSR